MQPTTSDSFPDVLLVRSESRLYKAAMAGIPAQSHLNSTLTLKALRDHEDIQSISVEDGDRKVYGLLQPGDPSFETISDSFNTLRRDHASASKLKKVHFYGHTRDGKVGELNRHENWFIAKFQGCSFQEVMDVCKDEAEQASIFNAIKYTHGLGITKPGSHLHSEILKLGTLDAPEEPLFVEHTNRAVLPGDSLHTSILNSNIGDIPQEMPLALEWGNEQHNEVKVTKQDASLLGVLKPEHEAFPEASRRLESLSVTTETGQEMVLEAKHGEAFQEASKCIIKTEKLFPISTQDKLNGYFIQDDHDREKGNYDYVEIEQLPKDPEDLLAEAPKLLLEDSINNRHSVHILPDNQEWRRASSETIKGNFEKKDDDIILIHSQGALQMASIKCLTQNILPNQKQAAEQYLKTLPHYTELNIQTNRNGEVVDFHTPERGFNTRGEYQPRSSVASAHR